MTNENQHQLKQNQIYKNISRFITDSNINFCLHFSSCLFPQTYYLVQQKIKNVFPRNSGRTIQNVSQSYLLQLALNPLANNCQTITRTDGPNHSEKDEWEKIQYVNQAGFLCLQTEIARFHSLLSDISSEYNRIWKHFKNHWFFFFPMQAQEQGMPNFPRLYQKKKKNPVGYKVLSGQNSHKLHKYSWNKYILPISFSERFKAWCRMVTTCRKKFFSKKAKKHLSVNEKIYKKTFFTLIWKEIRHPWDRITNGIRGQYT